MMIEVFHHTHVFCWKECFVFCSPPCHGPFRKHIRHIKLAIISACISGRQYFAGNLIVARRQPLLVDSYRSYLKMRKKMTWSVICPVCRAPQKKNNASCSILGGIFDQVVGFKFQEMVALQTHRFLLLNMTWPIDILTCSFLESECLHLRMLVICRKKQGLSFAVHNSRQPTTSSECKTHHHRVYLVYLILNNHRHLEQNPCDQPF